MKPCKVYLVESGFPENLPGFLRELPSASFPFWGNYCLLDFAVAAFSDLDQGRFTIMAETRYRTLTAFLADRGQKEHERLQLLDQGIDSFMEAVGRDGADTVLICPLHLVCDPQPGAIRRIADNHKQGIVRISIQNVETDIYIASRRALERACDLRRKKKPLGTGLGHALFSELLHTSFSAKRNLPGRILFQGNLTQLFRENHRLVGQNGAVEHLQRLSNPGKSAAKGALIDKGGHARNSLICAGARVEGYVESSFLFPGVVVHRGATVVDSVIMNDNRIGAKAQLYKTLLLPYVGDLGTSNIGENASIGMRGAGARNFDYPKQVCEGVTVIGSGAEVPKGLKIGSGCLIGARVGSGQLRSIKELSRSSTVLRREEGTGE